MPRADASILSAIRVVLDDPSNHADWCSGVSHQDCCRHDMADCDCPLAKIRSLLDAKQKSPVAPMPNPGKPGLTFREAWRGHTDAEG